MIHSRKNELYTLIIIFNHFFYITYKKKFISSTQKEKKYRILGRPYPIKYQELIIIY